ncbi:MAG: hypothetical protein ABSH29_26895, partial [Acidimicrobiales bacterium]
HPRAPCSKLPQTLDADGAYLAVTIPPIPTGSATSDEHEGRVDSDPVLDAAASCYLRFGVAKTTAADIAQAVGI